MADQVNAMVLHVGYRRAYRIGGRASCAVSPKMRPCLVLPSQQVSVAIYEPPSSLRYRETGPQWCSGCDCARRSALTQLLSPSGTNPIADPARHGRRKSDGYTVRFIAIVAANPMIG